MEIARWRAFIALIGIVFLFFLALPRNSNAAGESALFLSPRAGTFLVGSTFDLSILLDTKGAAINTVEVELLFPADKMQIASPSVGKSFIQIWPASPVFSNREGRIYFAGGIPSPGISTSQGVVLTLTFRVTAPGQAEIKFGEKTNVLANDGQGTNILGQRPSSFYLFQIPPPQGPVISSPTHPDQEQWYRDPDPVLVWPKSQFADGYSYTIDRNPSGFPDTISEGAQSTASFQSIDNGTWYFHLRERAGGVWGGVSHYVVKIDNELPASFRVNVSPALRTTSKNPILRFFTTDALSGLSHDELKIIPLSGDGGSAALFFEVTSPYQMADLAQGRYQVIVRALDNAGNARDEAVLLTIVGPFNRFFDPEGIDLVIGFIPWSWILWFVGAAVLICILILAVLWRKHRRKDEHRLRLRDGTRNLRHTFAEAMIRLFKRISRRGALGALLLVLSGLTLFAVSHRASKEPEAKSGSWPARLAMDAAHPLTRSALVEGMPSFGMVSGGIRLALASSKKTFLGFIGNAFLALSQATSPKTLTAPTIAVAPMSYYPLDEVLYLEGAAPPKATIDILFERPGSRPVRVGAESNSNGEWFFNSRLELARGDWMVRARVASDPPSDWSNPRIIQSAVSGFTIGSFKIKFVPVILILGALFILGFVLLVYSFLRIHRARHREFEAELHQKDKQLAASLVEQDFSELRRKMAQELSPLDHKLKEGILSADEEERRGKLLRELDEVEQRIEKKIKEIV